MIDKLNPVQVAWFGRIAELLPGMIESVEPDSHQDLRLDARRRSDGALVEVWLLVRCDACAASPMAMHGTIVGSSANDEKLT